jgi:integrase
MATTKKGARVEPGIWKHPDGQGYLAEINYTDPRTNRRIRERKSIHRIDLAREWRQTRQTDALRGEVRRRKDGPKPMTFSQLADEYLEIWSQVKKKPSSYIRDQTSVKRLRQVFGRRVISDITRRDVERYFAGRSTDMVGKGELRHPVTPATLNRELCCLKNMLRKAVDWGYLASNPAGDVKQSRESPPEFDYLTEDEIDRLLEGCGSPQLRAIVTVAVHTGMRRGEIFGLQWRDVAFDKGENGLITVRKPKNDDTRYIPMNQAVREALSGYPKRIVAGKLCPWVFSGATGSPLTDVKKGFANALRRAGIERHIRFHDLRHTFASHLVMKGVDQRAVAKLGGWRDIQMVMRYAHLAPAHLQAAVDRLVERGSQNPKVAAGA